MTCVCRCRSSSSFVRHRVRQSFISRTVWHRITNFYTNIHADLLDSHTGYDAISVYTSSKETAQNAASDGFGSGFSGVAFCLPHQLVGFLLGTFRDRLGTLKFRNTLFKVDEIVSFPAAVDSILNWSDILTFSLNAIGRLLRSMLFVRSEVSNGSNVGRHKRISLLRFSSRTS